MILGDQRKSVVEMRSHFIDRLKERHAILLTDDEYDGLCTKENIFKNFRGKFKKRSEKTVGYLTIKGETVIALLFHFDNGSYFATVYPPGVDLSDAEIMKVCFGRSVVNKIAAQCYEQFVSEISEFEKIKGLFSTKIEAGKYLYVDSPFCFSRLLIEIYNTGGYDKWRMCQIINNIIYGRSAKLKLVVKKIQ